MFYLKESTAITPMPNLYFSYDGIFQSCEGNKYNNGLRFIHKIEPKLQSLCEDYIYIGMYLYGKSIKVVINDEIFKEPFLNIITFLTLKGKLDYYRLKFEIYDQEKIL